MIRGYQIFDNVINREDQIALENYVLLEDNKWNITENITGYFGGNFEKFNFPGRVLLVENFSQEIVRISSKIREKVCDLISVEHIKTYRCKINHTKKLEAPYDPRYLMHVDMYSDHMVIVYYINDATGDTKIFKNESGNDATNIERNLKSINFSDFSLIDSIAPKKGRALVFDGNLYHYGDYPSEGERFVMNIDLIVKGYGSKKII